MPVHSFGFQAKFDYLQRYKSLFLSLSLTHTMYGGSKFGRGSGGRGNGSKRNHSSFPLQPSNRPAGGTRLSLGGSVSASNTRVRGSGVRSSASAQPVEESFRLNPGKDPLAYGMIIRLAPDLVDEIRRVEAQGGTARVKFGSMVNSSNGNVSFLYQILCIY